MIESIVIVRAKSIVIEHALRAHSAQYSAIIAQIAQIAPKTGRALRCRMLIIDPKMDWVETSRRTKSYHLWEGKCDSEKKRRKETSRPIFIIGTPWVTLRSEKEKKENSWRVEGKQKFFLF